MQKTVTIFLGDDCDRFSNYIHLMSSVVSLPVFLYLKPSGES